MTPTATSRQSIGHGRARARIWLVALLLATLALAQARPAAAGYADYFPPQPGFTHTSLRADDIPPGLGVSGAPFFRGGPVIGEVDGSTADGKEIVIAGRDGRVYAYHSSGALLWEVDVPGLASCTLTDPIGDAKINSVPAIGALYGDGVPYVLVGYGTVQNTNCPGGVIAIRGNNHTTAWNFVVAPLSSNGFLDGVASSPALADVDHDGTLEVAFGAFDREVYLLEHTSAIRWHYQANDTVWSSPAFANIDADPDLELIVGTDITGNPDGGYVYAFDTQPVPGGQKKYGTGYIWRNTYNQVIYSSPAVADLDGDGRLEVAIGSGCFYNNGIGAGRWVKVLDAATGAEKITLNSLGCSRSSPAVGNLDSDPQLEVVTVVNGQFSGKTYSWVQAWDWNNPNAKWTTIPSGPLGGDDPNADDLGSAIIADLDGNGSPEVIVSYSNSVVVLNGANGAQLTCGGSGCGAQRSLFAWMPLKSTPAVGDIDNSGDLELVVGGSHAGGDFAGTPNGFLYVWTDFAGKLGSPAGAAGAYAAPWPMFRGNPQHTGTLPELQVAPRAITSVIQVGQSDTTALAFNLSDGRAFSWSVVASDPQNIVQLNRTSGTSADTLLVTLNAPATVGTYNASLQVQVPGYGSLTVPVELIAAQQVSRTRMPLLRR